MAAVGVSLAHSVTAEVQQAGPNGGRLLDNSAPRAEFLVDDDDIIILSFYDENLKPVAASTQSATVTVDDKGRKTKLEFLKQGKVLSSAAPLPPGDGYDIIVQLRRDASSKPENFRISYDTHTCGGCNRAEYACTCEE